MGAVYRELVAGNPCSLVAIPCSRMQGKRRLGPREGAGLETLAFAGRRDLNREPTGVVTASLTRNAGQPRRTDFENAQAQSKDADESLSKQLDAMSERLGEDW